MFSCQRQTQLPWLALVRMWQPAATRRSNDHGACQSYARTEILHKLKGLHSLLLQRESTAYRAFMGLDFLRMESPPA